ncbi:GLUG motif-containing protein, partial [Staphylococcus aureus]
VTATGSSVGGLVGQQVGTISQSYAGGPVSGLSSVGGLAGFSLSGAMISDAYATGTVSGLPGSSKVGGLVGYNQGTITRTYAAGSVSGSIDVG